jgi:hypothetical protein
MVHTHGMYVAYVSLSPVLHGKGLALASPSPILACIGMVCIEGHHPIGQSIAPYHVPTYPISEPIRDV